MAWYDFTKTLHFRITTALLVLLGISAGAFWLWIDATVYSPELAQGEETWYEDLAEGELDSLASLVGPRVAVRQSCRQIMAGYGAQIDQWDAEVIIFDPDGVNICSSNPDSLDHAVVGTDPALLTDMSAGDWDYSSYPVADDMSAYENRIFEVDRLFAPDDPDSTVIGFLAANFRPYTLTMDEMAGDKREVGLGIVGVFLLYTVLGSLLIMAWATRRVRQLSHGVAEFAAGNHAARVNARSADELGALGRNFNRMAERIGTMLEELRNKERFQRQLVANISHDLRTPMASLRGYAETLSVRGDQLSLAERRKYLDIITGNLDHLDRLIDHTLVLSRFDSGQTVMKTEDFPLAELVDSVLLRCENLAAAKNVTLSLEDHGKDALVQADPLQISQVLQNLVENGIKFNDDGGSVCVTLDPADDRVQVTVGDTGRGIPAEDLPHIFERFYTGDKSRTRQVKSCGTDDSRDHLGQSSGLGLAIATKIVAAHNSQLEVESTQGGGSRFRFHLPRAEPEVDQDAPA